MSKNGYDHFLDYQFNYSGEFFKLLFKTMFQADPTNLEKLGLSFPEEADAVELWKFTPGGKEILLSNCTPGYALLDAVRDGRRLM